MLPDDATPQIDCLIALAQAEHPGYGRTEQAEFYEAVHMELAPVARQLERDARKWRMRLHQLRLDVLSVMPENWREDPDWVKLAENQKLTTKVGAGDTAKKAQMLDKAAIEKLCNEQFTLSIAQFVKNVESEVLRRNGLTPNLNWASVAQKGQNMSKETGGPAFPFAATDTSNEQMQAQGMALRDYFAAKAMSGSLAHDAAVDTPDRFATWCYEMADAMLSARGTD